jgi:RNA polymerase sigma-70 factor, ECF subfamily
LGNHYVSHPMTSDETLVERARSGDLASFEELVARYRDLIVRVTTRIVGPSDAEDVAQDTFLRAFHRLRQFRGDAPFRSWLLRIARNSALNALSERGAGGETPPQHDPGGEQLEDPGRPPAEELEVAERRDRLALKLLEIQPTHRTVLVLRDLEGLSYEEIADVTQAPLGSVKGWIFRARRELIDVLRRNTYDWELPA